MQDVKDVTDLIENRASRGCEPKPWQRRLKRAMDIVGSGLALLVLSPLLALIAVMVWWKDGPPVLYEWRVVGKAGVPFLSWKFRTMGRDADQQKQLLQDMNEMTGPVFKMANDPRVTPLGRVLRRFSLDELPQLWSVLKGDMSLVGPRPPLVVEYERFMEWQKRKLSVTPGLTCLWQVSGRSDIKDFDEWVRMDLKYIQEWSIRADFKILLRTVSVIFNGRGAY